MPVKKTSGATRVKERAGGENGGVGCKIMVAGSKSAEKLFPTTKTY